MKTPDPSPMSGESARTERPISGDDIIFEILRNFDAGQFPIRRVIVVPCVYHVYLHPSDYDVLRPVLPALISEARAALIERAEELNNRARPSKVVKFLGFDDSEPREYRILDPGWTIDFYPDLEDKLGRGDLEVHSDLASAPRPEFEGAVTRHVTRKQTPDAAPSSPAEVRSFDSDATVPVSRPTSGSEKIYGWLRYSDAGNERTFAISKDEIAIGRGGKTVWVDVQLNAPPDISREHCRIRRDAVSGRFFLKDLSQFGTALDGHRVPSSIDRTGGAERDVSREVELPAKGVITLADVVTIQFEARVSGHTE